MYAIIHMNVDVRSSAISSSEKESSSILQVCSIMSEVMKNPKRAQVFFVTLWILQKRCSS
jgi:hypothetical protein